MAGGSISRPPLHIEDGASMAFRADEPFAPARVSESEGAAPNRSRRQTDGAPRTLRRLPRGHRRPYLALLVDGELRVFGAHDPATVMTTFPNCWPD